MLNFVDCKFSAEGASKNDKVYGLTLSGSEDINIENCTFDGQGYAALLNKTAGNVAIKNSIFKCDNIKNPIEGGQASDQGNLTVENCDFEGTPGNNFINFYSVKDDSTHVIKNCRFHGSTSNNVIRLSNKTNHAATFKIQDLNCEFIGEPNEYTGAILCQDYTNASGNKQDFSKYHLVIDNLEMKPSDTRVCYVYEDGAGIIETNYPSMIKDGQQVVWGSGESMIEEDEDN